VLVAADERKCLIDLELGGIWRSLAMHASER
jgi:hypothetical protein